MSGTTVRLRGIRWIADRGLPDEREVLRGIDLELRSGDRLGLVGRSGSGKTTLATIVAGLLEPTAGEVEGTAALVFQEPERSFFEETVREDVAFGPRNRGLPDSDALARADEALATCGLDPARFGPRAPETLSGGEARRAAIAGVVAFRPDLLVFDEPTSGLDAGGVAQFRAVLAALRARGAGYLLISHDAALLAAECERALVLEDGRIAWDGPADRIAERWPDADLGAIADVAEAFRARGWRRADDPVTPEALAEAWASRANASGVERSRASSSPPR